MGRPQDDRRQDCAPISYPTSGRGEDGEDNCPQLETRNLATDRCLRRCRCLRSLRSETPSIHLQFSALRRDHRIPRRLRLASTGRESYAA